MENQEIVKNALSYSLGSDLHEIWRATRKLPDGSYEPRMKKSKDTEWNLKHGTDDVDIANLTFAELPSNWQYENLEAARIVINLVFDKVIANEPITPDEVEKMATTIHDEWLKRNDWVFDANYGNPIVAVPFEQLPEDEKEKDRQQLKPAINKVIEYMTGKMDISSICEQYGLSITGKVK